MVFANLIWYVSVGYVYNNIDKSLVLVRDHFKPETAFTTILKIIFFCFSSHLNDILLLMSCLI